MKLPICLYGYDLESDLRRLHDEVRKLTERQIDGDNISPRLLGPGLEFTDFTSDVPGTITTTITNTSYYSYFSPKTDGFTTHGMELIVNSASQYGRFCIVDKDNLDSQLISLIPEDPSTVVNPGGEFVTPLGTWHAKGRAGDEFVFNETSIDTDFRVESSGQTHGLFVDWGNARVGVNNSAPATAFNVTGDIRLSGTVQFDGTGTNLEKETTVFGGVSGIKGLSFVTDNAILAGFDSILGFGEADGTFDTPDTFFQRSSAARFSVTGALDPAATNTYDAGTTSLGWKEIYVRIIDTDGANDLTIQRNNVTRVTITSADADFAGAVDTNTSFKVGGTKVVGEQGTAVADASGGAIIDTEARAALNALLARVRNHGLIAT
jgi:hypothetical protein